MPMTYDEKLDLILERLTAIEAKLELVPVADEPVPVGGLYVFVRPAPGTPRYGLGIPMTSPDAHEAIKRACSCVDWTGMQRRSVDENVTWKEIERLKSEDAVDLEPYRALEPEMAGFGLLTGLFDVIARDGATFGVNAARREACIGSTVQSFLDAQFGIVGGPGIGGE